MTMDLFYLKNFRKIFFGGVEKGIVGNRPKRVVTKFEAHRSLFKG